MWHEGRYELIAGCVAPVYTRHDESGTLRVTPEPYAAKIAAGRRGRPNTRFIVDDHVLIADRARFCFARRETEPSTGETRTQAGMQVYWIEGDKLAETSLPLLKPDSAWPGAAGQEHWTRKRGDQSRDRQTSIGCHNVAVLKSGGAYGRYPGSPKGGAGSPPGAEGDRPRLDHSGSAGRCPPGAVPPLHDPIGRQHPGLEGIPQR